MIWKSSTIHKPRHQPVNTNPQPITYNTNRLLQSVTCLTFFTSGVSLAGDVALDELLELLELRSKLCRPLALLPFSGGISGSHNSSSWFSFRIGSSIIISGRTFKTAVASLYLVKLSSCNTKHL